MEPLMVRREAPPVRAGLAHSPARTTAGHPQGLLTLRAVLSLISALSWDHLDPAAPLRRMTDMESIKSHLIGSHSNFINSKF